MTKTLQELQTQYHELFYVEDRALFPLLLAIVVGSKLNTPTTWLYIVGPSSGGKGTVLSTIDRVSFVKQISDLTPNTFLSGMKIAGRETSLLKTLGNNFLVTMKDFTTMISKDETAQGQIMAQMREIYDGYISKATGNGQTIEWGTLEKKWKSTFIMATTEEIYNLQEKFVGMGTRAINYVFLPQDRKKTMRASLMNKRNTEKSGVILSVLQGDVSEFIADKIANAPHELPPISEELENDIIEVSDLSSQCRSVTKRNYRGEKQLTLSAEFPMRMGEQLLAIAQLLAYINDGELTTEMRAIIYKCAFDSIPKQRRMVLESISRYEKIEVIGMSKELRYPIDTIRTWVEDLYSFDILERESSSGKEYWKIREEYREVMRKYLGITNTGEVLESDENGNVAAMKNMTWQQRQEALNSQMAFEEI